MKKQARHKAGAGSRSSDTPRSSRGLNTVRRETLKERIYQELRRALQDGKFEPGEPITVKLLENELRAGSMPIREAIQRLVAEGALMNLPTGRVRVPLFTAEEYDAIKEIRLRLEGLAVHDAAIRADDATVAEIILRYKALMEAVTGDADWTEVIHLNYLFHFAIYAASQSKHLLAMIDSLWLRVSPLLIIPLKKPRQLRSEWLSIHEDTQKRLIRALRHKDGRAAESAIREIILASAAWYHRHHDFSGARDTGAATSVGVRGENASGRRARRS